MQQSDTHLNGSPVIIKSSGSSSIKSLTLPTSKSIGHAASPNFNANLPSHLSVRNVNFQLTSKTLSSSSISSLNKSNSASDSSLHDKTPTSDAVKQAQNVFAACLPFLNILNVGQKDVEETWRVHVMSVFNKRTLSKPASSAPASGINLLETFILFKKLVKESRRSMNTLLVDSCEMLSPNNSTQFSSINKRFMSVLDCVNKKLKCPLVFLDQDLIANHLPTSGDSSDPASKSPQADLRLAPTYSFLDKHRQIVWEIGENFDTFASQRKVAREALESLKRLVNSSTKNLNDAQLKFEKVI